MKVRSDDERQAETVRQRLLDLRYAIQAAQSAGLTVKVPELVHMFLSDGVASGNPNDWEISRLYR